MNETLKGHPIRFDEDLGVFVFSDNGAPTEATWRERDCGHCGKASTPEGHDGCLGTLPGVINACCGHGGGESWSAYVQFADGAELRGPDALAWFKETAGPRNGCVMR